VLSNQKSFPTSPVLHQTFEAPPQQHEVLDEPCEDASSERLAAYRPCHIPMLRKDTLYPQGLWYYYVSSACVFVESLSDIYPGKFSDTRLGDNKEHQVRNRV
jgi:hypothetical protein